jgi:hypothetical protein
MSDAHKFMIGQSVNYKPGRRGQNAPPGAYLIIGRLPRNNGQMEYRIKHSTELLERIAREGELRLA